MGGPGARGVVVHHALIEKSKRRAAICIGRISSGCRSTAVTFFVVPPRTASLPSHPSVRLDALRSQERKALSLTTGSLAVGSGRWGG